MIETIIAFVVALVGTPLAILFTRRMLPGHEGLGVAAVVAHLAAALVMVWVTRDYYGYGDMLKYHRVGVRLSDVMSSDLLHWGPQVTRLVLHQANEIVGVPGNGGPTGTMFGISAWLAYLLGGSLQAACIALSLFAFSGNVALVRSLMMLFPRRFHNRIVLTLFLPSVVFWTAGILKEAVALGGLGWLFWAFSSVILLRRPRRRVASVVVGAVAVASTVVIAITKPYILIPFTIAGAAAWYRIRALERPGAGPASLVRLALALVGVMIVVSVLGAIFPRYSTENVVDEVTGLREVGMSHAGGSTFDSATALDGGVGSYLLYSPLALATSLFRPVLVEVRNPLMLIAAIEMTLFAWLTAQVLRRGVRRAVAVVMSQPTLVFAAVFVVVFGTAVGLSTTNMGSLVRYRTPLLPFFAVLLIGLLPLRFPRRHGRRPTAALPRRSEARGPA